MEGLGNYADPLKLKTGNDAFFYFVNFVALLLMLRLPANSSSSWKEITASTVALVLMNRKFEHLSEVQIYTRRTG